MAIQHGPIMSPRVVSESKAVAVPVGARFVFRVKELLGHNFNGRMPPFEGQVLTVVRFEPRYINNVVVRDEDGMESLMRREWVERALCQAEGRE